MSVNRSHGIDKIYKMDKSGVQTVNKQRIYLIKSDLITAKYISDQINSEMSPHSTNQKTSQSSNVMSTCTYHIILVPRRLLSILNLFEEEGIIGCVKVYEFRMEMVLLDSKVLSDELHNFYKMLFVNGDQSYLPSVAKSIWTLQMLLGKPQLTVVQGKYSSIVYNMIVNYFDNIGTPDKVESDIGCLVIVDRDIDYASVLLTPGTYTSLLDEVFGVNCGTVEIKMDDDKVYKTHLNAADEIYMQIKNRHFSDVFTFLKSRAEVLRHEFNKSQNMTLQQMKQYVSKELKNIAVLKKLLTYHIGACEAIICKIGQRFEELQAVEHNMLNCKNHRDNFTYIENCIATDLGSKFDILRLISLFSLTNNGLTIDEMNTVKTQFLHKFGYRYLSAFHYLQNIGLVNEQQGIMTGEAPAGILANKVVQALPSLPMKRSAFYLLSQKLKLFPDIPDDYDLKNPKDMGYVFGGAYIPLICQLLSILIKKEIPPEELEKIIPNLNFKINNNGSKDINKQSYFVYIIGGMTYAEIAAFQLLEKLTGSNIFVAATSVINGSSLMKSVS
ncbi:vacuolar protein sorting 33B isoform X2 [Lycorma delicatula]|uniref:vacuolar protein sorting 33B isoform X2 n=1 Tax=Lycorma delicatula TaxID=130591 RepID=UPI003F5184FE